MANSRPSTPPIEEASPMTDLLTAMSALLTTGRYSDLMIICNYRRWAVHKAILCSRSAFFDGACSGSFSEANSGVIDLSEEDVDAVEQMINFFYHLDYLQQPQHSLVTSFRHRQTSHHRRHSSKRIDLSTIPDPLLSQAGAYSDPLSPSTSESSRGSLELPEGKYYSRPATPESMTDAPPTVDESFTPEEDNDTSDAFADAHLLLHTRVYALAEKYDIPALKQLARSKFETALACFYDSPDFAATIEEVYHSTIDSDRGLRDIVLEAFKAHPQLAQTPDVYSVIKDTPSLALELFKVERGIPV